MAHNPGDKRGPFQSGQQRCGIILNRNDPLKNNRYLVQCHGADGDGAPPQWMTVQNQGTGLAGLGKPTRHMQGDQVFMEEHGGNTLSIKGSYRKEGEGDQSDYRPEERSEGKTLFADPMGGTETRRNPTEWGKPGTEISYEAALGLYGGIG